jgi:ribosome-associated protein YbcJ (S4-like RNA binding protein)
MKERGKMEFVEIHSEYITLGQMMKYMNVVDSGGRVKDVLNELVIYVNDVRENRRGKKLHPGDTVFIKGIGEFKIVSK